jgi:3-oxoacid CoA-transferase subunit A
MKKVYASANEALDGVLKDGMLIAAGGFGLCGIPENLITAIRESGVKNLTVHRTTRASMISGSGFCCRRVR